MHFFILFWNDKRLQHSAGLWSIFILIARFIERRHFSSLSFRQSKIGLKQMNKF